MLEDLFACYLMANGTIGLLIGLGIAPHYPILGIILTIISIFLIYIGSKIK